MFSSSCVSLEKTPILVLWIFIAFSIFYTCFSFGYPYIQADQLQNARTAAYNNGYQAASNDAMRTLSGETLKNGYNNGYTTAFVSIGKALMEQYKGGCKEAVPLTFGGSGAIGIVSIDCINQAQSGAVHAQKPTPAPVTPSIRQ
jgi:preprotein translocase subunit SecY